MKKGIDAIGVAVVYFCHDGQGRVVMSKRSAASRDEIGTWDIGAGALELGETVDEALRKEIREEYCTDVLSYEFLGYRDVHREHLGEKTHWLALDFAVLVDPAKVANGEPHKLDAVEWFTLDTLPENMHSQWPNFMRLYGERLRKL